jgi:hypothetical protein
VPHFKAGKELRDRVDAKLNEEESAKATSASRGPLAAAAAGS